MLISSAALVTVQLGTVAAASGGTPSRVTTITSTVPHNGDINPYGIVVVRDSAGDLKAGDVLVSNFNAASNLQGTGTTIDEISPSGSRHVFATISQGTLPTPCPGGIGLTTALSVLRGGFVAVGSLPTRDGTAATARAGCLIVLDSEGRAIEVLSGGGIDGPWDMTETDTATGAALFVTNVLNGTVNAGGGVVSRGTVLRIDLRIARGHAPVETARIVIGSGFDERTDPAALVIGPTGVGLAGDGTLYVADSLHNRIAAIADAVTRTGSAGTGRTVSVNGSLNDPLGLTVGRNGDILTVNGADGNLIETSATGAQVEVTSIDSSGSPPGSGALFGLALAPHGGGLYFVDDATNTLNLLH